MAKLRNLEVEILCHIIHNSYLEAIHLLELMIYSKVAVIQKSDIKSFNFRYVRALGAFYLRLTGSGLDCYKYLEPLLNDYRKIRMQRRDGSEYACFES